ncbi:MAG: hypothetical protein WC708_12700 [Lentisphaeria bacterium]
MKNSFHFALRTGHHEVLLLAPLLGCLLLAASLFVPRFGNSPPPEDPDRFRRVTQMGAIDRTMAAICAALAAESPLVVKERVIDAPPPPEAAPVPALPSPANPDAGTAPPAVSDEPASVGAAGGGPAPAAAPAPPALVLAGVAWRSGRTYAIINRRVIGIGEEINGWRLVTANWDSVILQDGDGHQQILTLGQQENPPP